MARRIRVLVADDNQDAANTLAMLLELSGYEVQVAYDGEAAVQLAVRWPPDAAILDITMPGRDGYEVARTLRGRLPQLVALVAHSALLTLRQRDLDAASVFDVCCSKGMEFDELRDQLDALLRVVPTVPAEGAAGSQAEFAVHP
jgi:CheY-like chemotaxis protein